ncbi:GDSL esterase/lipase [Acorus calamus]|uniref:GDSL esterase/lipase n=1 Tax=Acorus calamus TaxID=4465 RepID=A0AAV9DQ55_ACOCL|nr:GDSL esterase/lipase [Acorus calamus]
MNPPKTHTQSTTSVTTIMASCNGLSVFLLTLITTTSCILVSSSYAQTVPALFMFGDSLVDVGNNNYLPLSLLKANFPHNGVDYPGRKPTGRFSNGRNAADFIADKLGIPTSPPYLSLTSATNKSNAFLGGVSFASGGGGILDTTNKGKCLSLNKQIEYHTVVYSNLVQLMGSAGAQQYLSRSLFAVVIGSNDILGYFGSQNKVTTPQQFVNSLVLTLQDQLKRIYNLGGRKFAFVGVGPIGCSPAKRSENSAGDCEEDINSVCTMFNEAVKSLLSSMKTNLPDMSYSFFDTYVADIEYIQNPSKYGFAEVKAACCGLGYLNAKIACTPISTYCPNRKDHLFWDLYHPTETVSRMLSNTAFDGSPPSVDPINIRQLVGL